jgi:hypothetical protein
MAWVRTPCVHIVTLLGGWHVELQTPIVLGGRANVECTSSVGYPTGADGGVVVGEAFSTDRLDWYFVEVIKAVDLLVGRFAGVTA